ncbi:MAG: hypothetical protein RIS70_2134, partial [Planctomycetota bacterium]
VTKGVADALARAEKEKQGKDSDDDRQDKPAPEQATIPEAVKVSDEKEAPSDKGSGE